MARDNENNVLPIEMESHFSDFLLHQLFELYGNGDSCDVSLATERDNKKILAHYAVLLSANTNFRTKLVVDPSDASKRILTLLETDFYDLKLVIDFCYTGSLKITIDNLEPILNIARDLKFEMVKTLCRLFVEEDLTVDNWLEYLSLARRHANDQMVLSVFDFGSKHFDEVVESEQFLKMDVVDLWNLLKDDNLNVWSEKEVLNAINKWFIYGDNKKLENMKLLLSAVRFSKIGNEFLNSKKLLYFCKENKCKDLFISAITNSIHNVSLMKPRNTMPRLFVIGDSFGSTSECPEIYCQNRNKWIYYKMLGTQHNEFCAVVVGDQLYFMGGLSADSKTLHFTVKHNFSTGDVIKLPSMHERRSKFAATVLNDAIYVTGGTDSDTTERFDTIAEKWERMPKMSTKRMGHALVTWKKYIFAIGGMNDTEELDSVEYFDKEKNQWAPTAPLNHKRVFHGAAVCNGFIFVVGGGHNSIEYFDPTIKKWMNLYAFNSLPIMDGCGIVAYDEHLYVAGGKEFGRSCNRNQFYRLNPRTGEMVELASMNEKRCFGKLFVMPPYNPSI